MAKIVWRILGFPVVSGIYQIFLRTLEHESLGNAEMKMQAKIWMKGMRKKLIGCAIISEPCHLAKAGIHG
jgi:hypothetical protein